MALRAEWDVEGRASVDRRIWETGRWLSALAWSVVLRALPTSAKARDRAESVGSSKRDASPRNDKGLERTTSL